MRQVKENKLRRLVSESLRESNDSYTIQELFERFPTATELMDTNNEIRLKYILVYLCFPIVPL